MITFEASPQSNTNLENITDKVAFSFLYRSSIQTQCLSKDFEVSGRWKICI